MKQIADLFGTYHLAPDTKSHRTERGDLITEFTEKLNQDRVGRKPLAVSAVAYLLSPYSVSDLYLLLRKCNEAKSFGALFWYHTKPKKN